MPAEWPKNGEWSEEVGKKHESEHTTVKQCMRFLMKSVRKEIVFFRKLGHGAY